MGRLSGVVEVRAEGTTGYFGMLAVDPSVRRAGVGRALVEAAENHCRGAGCTVMTLSTGEDRTELIPYYESDRALNQRSVQARDPERQNG